MCPCELMKMIHYRLIRDEHILFGKLCRCPFGGSNNAQGLHVLEDSFVSRDISVFRKEAWSAIPYGLLGDFSKGISVL